MSSYEITFTSEECITLYNELHERRMSLKYRQHQTNNQTARLARQAKIDELTRVINKLPVNFGGKR